MKTAIVGLGNIGAQVAANLALNGHKVIVAERDRAKAKALAEKLGEMAQDMDVDDTAKQADIIILAISFQGIKEFLVEHRAALRGKIIVDPSNPIAPDGKGGFTKIIAAEESSGKIVAGLAPEGTEVVKAFGTLGAQSLGSAASRSPERAALFYATDYPEAGKAVAGLITASGFDPVNVGGIDQSIRIEVGGDLHEFGKLGKVVSAKEAQTLV